MTILLDRESCSGNLCRLVIGIQERRGSLSVSDKADDHQCGGAGDSAWHRGTKAKGGADKLPTNAHHKARCHAGDNAGLGGLLPVQGCEGRQTRGGGIEAPGEHEDVIGILDVQSDDQCAQWQDEGKHAGQAQFLLLGDIGLEDLINIVDTGLDGDDEIAVRRGHDDRQDTRQSKTRQAHRQNLNGQGGHHGVGGAILGDLIGADQLMGHHTHKPHQRDGEPVDESTQEQALSGSLLALGGKGSLPHLRTGQGKDKVGDDITDDAAVHIGRGQFRGQILQKHGESAQLGKGCRRDHDVHEQDQHDELKHVRIDDAEQAGGGGVDDEHRAGDQRAHLVGDADFIAQHVDDGGGGRHLRGHGTHHGKGDEAAQDHLGGLAEALLEQVGDRGDVEGGAHSRDTSSKARENEHAQQIGQRRHNGLEAAGIRHTGATHQTAAANDGGADSGHQHQRAERTSAQIVVVGALYLFHHHYTDDHHGNEIGGDDA